MGRPAGVGNDLESAAYVTPVRQTGVLALLWLWSGGCAHHPVSTGAPSPGAGDAQGKKVLVYAPDPAARPAGDQPWGAPVPDQAAETTVRETLASIALGQGGAGRFSLPLVVGPALWKAMVAADGALEHVGEPSFTLVQNADGSSQKMDMRSFGDEAAVGALTRSFVCRKVAALFVSGTIRAANSDERKLFYAFVPFELAGRPLPIAEHGRDRLVVYLDEHRRPGWIDIISAYVGSAAQAAAPAARPSTPEERTRFAALARRIESAPPQEGQATEPELAWGLDWISVVTDIHVKLCANVLDPLANEKLGFNASLVALVGAGAVAAQHVGQPGDAGEATVAAVVAVVHAYAAERKRGGPASALVDDLARRERDGTLPSHILEQTRICTKSAPQP
jgi:hypothetical protein